MVSDVVQVVVVVLVGMVVVVVVDVDVVMVVLEDVVVVDVLMVVVVLYPKNIYVRRHSDDPVSDEYLQMRSQFVVVAV